MADARLTPEHAGEQPGPPAARARIRRLLISLPVLVLSGTGALAQPAPAVPTDPPRPVTQEENAAAEQAVAPYIRTARATYPAARARFLAGLPPGQNFYVVTRLTDPDGRWEQAFIRVQTIEGDSISGFIATHLQFVRGFTPGQAYSFRDTELIDWVITRPDGSEEGNVVGKFLDTQP